MADSTKDADFQDHQKTYDGFIKVGKWGTVIMAVLLVVLYFVVNP